MKEKTSKYFTVFLLIILFSSCYSQNIIKNFKAFDVPVDSINIFLKTRMDSLNIPGLSIAIINDSKVVYHQTFGYAKP